MQKITCPQCHAETSFSPDNPYRPFCCERCKLLDLGSWADGRYSIAEPLDPAAAMEAAGDVDKNLAEEDSTEYDPQS
jgi:uncharacterized protein